MKNSEDRFLSKQEQKRNYEILHGTVADVVVRTDILGYEDVRALGEQFFSGFPVGLIKHGLDGWVDSMENPRFYIKLRGRIAREVDVAGRIASRRRENPKARRFTKEGENAFLSIMQEIAMTGRIHEVVNEQEVQNYGRRLGFFRVAYAEPLFG